MSDNTNDLLNKLIENHQKTFDLKDPAKHEEKVKQNFPKYIIVAKGIFDDTHNGYKNAGQCFTFKTSIYRMHDPASTTVSPINQGKLVRKDVIACIPVGRWAASIQSHMTESIVLPTISIIRVEHSHEFENTIQKTDFNVCHIVTYDQVDDKIVFSFTYESKTDDFTDYAKDGTKRGHAAYTIKPDEVKEKKSKNPGMNTITV